VAGTNDAIEALARALAGDADILEARSLKEALAALKRGPFDTIACNVRFDESRMFEFLQAVTEYKHGGPLRIVAFRADDTALTHSTRTAIRAALEALGVERFADLSQLRAEFGDEVALETLRKMVLDENFTPPAPAGSARLA
jgi:hypothetical protein